RGGHHENASRLQHPPRFPQGPAEVLHRDQVAVPDHQVKIAVGSRECCGLDIDLAEVCLAADSRIAPVFVIVDNGTARGGELVTEDQGLPALAWAGLNLEEMG